MHVLNEEKITKTSTTKFEVLPVAYAKRLNNRNK